MFAEKSERFSARVFIFVWEMDTRKNLILAAEEVVISAEDRVN